MGGGNAQKSAMARQRNMEKAQAGKVMGFFNHGSNCFVTDRTF